jgi:3-oxoadipate enol-lactonase
MTELRYEGSDGCQLYAFSLTASIDKTKPVLIMLHGGGPDHYSLIPLARNIDYPQIVLPEYTTFAKHYKAMKLRSSATLSPGDGLLHFSFLRL